MAKIDMKDIAAGVFLWMKKAPSAAWWLLSKSPKLFRRGFQGAAIYAGSIVAEKALDYAHEKLPDNEFIAKADTIIQTAVNAENFLIGGATEIAKTAYDAVPMAKAAPLPDPVPMEKLIPPVPNKAENDVPEPAALPALETDPAKLEAESLKSAQEALLPQQSPTAEAPIAESPPREAAFMPIKPADRNRANLNAAIAAPIAAPPPAPILAPDGLPVEGGYEPTTKITWGKFMKPTVPQRTNHYDFKP